MSCVQLLAYYLDKINKCSLFSIVGMAGSCWGWMDYTKIEFMEIFCSSMSTRQTINTISTSSGLVISYLKLIRTYWRATAFVFNIIFISTAVILYDCFSCSIRQNTLYKYFWCWNFIFDKHKLYNLKDAEPMV